MILEKYERQFTEDDKVPLIPLGERANRGVFKCLTCSFRRLYGFGKPERKQYLLQCAQCKKHTWHLFMNIY